MWRKKILRFKNFNSDFSKYIEKQFQTIRQKFKKIVLLKIQSIKKMMKKYTTSLYCACKVRQYIIRKNTIQISQKYTKHDNQKYIIEKNSLKY